MNVHIQIIPHKAQRYPTVGDWWFKENTLQIRVSALGNSFEEQVIAIHEYVEALLCMKEGITQKEVDQFDMLYEQGRLEGVSDCQGEPGDSPRAPYKKQHCIATGIERILIAELDISWGEYEEKVNSL